MKNLIIILLSLVAINCSAQLATFTTVGYEDSEWSLIVTTINEGEIGGHYTPVNSDGDFKIHGEEVEWSVLRTGVYAIKMHSESKDRVTYLFITVPEEGVATDSVYVVRKKNVEIN